MSPAGAPSATRMPPGVCPAHTALLPHACMRTGLTAPGKALRCCNAIDLARMRAEARGAGVPGYGAQLAGVVTPLLSVMTRGPTGGRIATSAPSSASAEDIAPRPRPCTPVIPDCPSHTPRVEKQSILLTSAPCSALRP